MDLLKYNEDDSVPIPPVRRSLLIEGHVRIPSMACIVSLDILLTFKSLASAGDIFTVKAHPYSIEVSDLKRSYACCFEVLSEKKICGFISKIEDKRILNELKNKEIILSDLNCKETEIGLLIGADNIVKLLTGNLIEFDSGLTAIETKLGWTVIGKVCSNDKNVMLTTSSLHVRNVSIKELWELDVLGITDPLLNENTKENFELTDFKNKMKILPDGRYEVKLPWKCNSENLPSNKELTWKRHLRMMNKLRNGKFFEDYKKVCLGNGKI
ncbi:DUF1758 domain-containing protein [Trichonephila clavipes]|nr:DUF1758 domain-containing protein [Trichonephila clavipes]